MRAYKGFSPNLESRLGGKPVKFKIGNTYEEESSKTVRSGFHCCENPFECLSYYTYRQDRFCLVEAAGDIDEDDHERISCTKLTILKELSDRDFFLSGVAFMIQHPQRAKWEQNKKGVKVCKEYATAIKPGDIAIARGENPQVKAVPGAYVALIRDFGSGVLMTWAEEVEDTGVYYFAENSNEVKCAKPHEIKLERRKT